MEEIELEEGQELCPICESINNPGAEEFSCNHFIGLIWEGELHWADSELESISQEIELIQRLIEDKNVTTSNSPLFELLNPEWNSHIDVLWNLLAGDILIGENLKNDAFLNSGSGFSWYTEEHDNLSKLKSNLVKFKETIGIENL